MRPHPWRLLLLLRFHSRSKHLHIPTPLSLSHPLPPRHLSPPLFQNPSFRPFSSSELAIEPKDSDHVVVLTDIFSKSGAGFEMARETYIEVLGQFVKRKMIKDAVDLYEFAMGDANKPSIQDFTFLLRKVVVSKELDMDLFLKVIQAFTEGGNVLTDLNVYVVLKSLLSAGRLGECNKILKSMVEDGFLPTDTLRSKIAFQFSSKGEKAAAYEFVDTMEALGSSSNYKVWASLVEGHCVAGHLDEASDCFQKMVEEEGVPCVAYALELLVNAYCNKNRAMDACKLVIDMINEKQLKPSHSTYKLLTSKVLVQGGLKEALELLGCMKVDGFPPFLDPFIDYLSKTGTADEARLFLEGMTVKRVPSTAVFVRVFEAYLKAGRHNEAHNLLSNCPRYIRNHADILDLFFTMSDASKLLNEMNEKKIEPDNITCNTLINAYCKIGDLKSALRDFLQVIVYILGLWMDTAIKTIKRQLKGNIRRSVVYTSLAYAYLKTGEVTVASDLLDEMYRRRLMITLKLYRSFSASYADDKGS
ncbi:hypothetical protein C3L33_18691, partial [Rhododendron williamsianum]